MGEKLKLSRLYITIITLRRAIHADQFLWKLTTEAMLSTDFSKTVVRDCIELPF